jgi:hypothetical protein
MAAPVSYPAVWDDQEFYPLHEEDDVPEIPPHEATTRYLRDAVAARFPAGFVTGDVCIYWEPGNTTAHRAPDLLVVKEPLAEPVDRVYQTWKQPPVAFVAEIGSRSTFRIDEGPKAVGGVRGDFGFWIPLRRVMGRSCCPELPRS